MLTIFGQKLPAPVVVEFGDYVPFKFRCLVESKSPHLYWRAGNLESTLIEVEINPVDGQITAVALLLPGRVGKKFPVLGLPLNSSEGLPLFRIHDWPNDRVMDEPKPFQVFVDETRLLILLSDTVATRSMTSSQVTFGVCANDSLAWILVNDLNSERLAEFVSS